MFCKYYTNIDKFESVRKSAFIVLIVHLVFKFANVFLSYRYADQIFEA